MRKRTLSLLLAGTFLFGTAAACGDDEPETTPTEDDGGSGGDEGGGDEGGGGESGNADVEAYCDAADEFAAAVEEAGGDPALLGDLSTQAQELATQGGNLSANAGELTEEDGARIQECSQVVTDAAGSLTGG